MFLCPTGGPSLTCGEHATAARDDAGAAIFWLVMDFWWCCAGVQVLSFFAYKDYYMKVA